MTTEATANTTESAVTQGSPAPQATEPQTPATDTGKPSATAQDPQQTERDLLRKQVQERFADKPEAKEKPTPVEPVTPAAAATPTPTEEAGKAQNPKETPAAAAETAAAEDRRRKESIVVHDREGKEITVTLDQARRAILRDGAKGKFLDSMTKTDILEYGSARFLVQREWDQFSSQEGRRRAQENAGHPQTTATAPATPQPQSAASAPAGEAGSEPQPAAQVVAPTPQTQQAWRAKLAQLKDVAGEDVANSLTETLSEMQRETAERYHAELQQRDQAIAAMQNQYVDSLFRSGFKDLEADFPQLKIGKDNAKEVQELRQSIKANAEAIARSGRFPNPLDAFDEILREGAFATLGKQQHETAARKLLERRELQSAGQVDVVQARTSTPPAALSLQELSRLAVKKLEETGDARKVRSQLRDLHNTAAT